MNVESSEIVWLTANEAEQAIRDFVKAKGFKVLRWAPVGGLGGLSEAKHAVSVQTQKHTHEVM